MNEEVFEEHIIELHQDFFVMSEYKDERGAKVEEVILIKFLAKYPEMLAMKPLKWFVDEFIGKCYSEDVKNQMKSTLKI